MAAVNQPQYEITEDTSILHDKRKMYAVMTYLQKQGIIPEGKLKVDTSNGLSCKILRRK